MCKAVSASKQMTREKKLRKDDLTFVLRACMCMCMYDERGNEGMHRSTPTVHVLVHRKGCLVFGHWGSVGWLPVTSLMIKVSAVPLPSLVKAMAMRFLAT